MTEPGSAARLLCEAITALDRAAEQPSDQLTAEAATALRAVVRLRTALLERRRAQAPPQPRTQELLDAANAALSLVSGVPAGKNRARWLAPSTRRARRSG